MTATAEFDVTAETKKAVPEATERRSNPVWSALDNPNSDRARAKALFEAQYIQLHDLREKA